MKKVFILLLLLAVIICIPVFGLAMGDGAVVNNPNPKDRLHLRTEPNSSAQSLGKYYNGTHVVILEYRDDGWVKVGVGDINDQDKYQLEGYMMKKYLTSDFNDASDKVKSAMPEYMTDDSSWELYRQPSMTSASDTSGYGEEIRLMGFTDAWWHIAIMYKGEIEKTGFVPAKNTMISPAVAVVSNPNPKDRLHMRQEPSTGAKSLGKYYNGVLLKILGYYQDQEWARVRIGKTEGYMLTKYLAFAKDVSPVSLAAPSVRVIANKVTLREKPSTSGKSLGSFSKGKNIRVWGLCGNWLHVAIGSHEGFMQASLLSPVPNNSGQPPKGKTAVLIQDAEMLESIVSASGQIVRLNEGDRVTVFSKGSKWCYARVGNVEAEGWIPTSALRFEN